MTGIRENIGRRVLRKKRKGFQRHIHAHNFETAQSVVLLFNTGENNSFSVINSFRKFLKEKGISCSAYGYVEQKEIPQEMLLRKNLSFVTRNDLNWYLKPTGEVIETFFKEDPDILVDFTREMPLELQFMVQLSTARFKIGTYTEQENDYDLMINLSEPADMEYLAEQIKHYVSILQPSN
jgi:hypothetical protein